MSLLDWKIWSRSSLARSVMCIFVVFGWFLEIWKIFVRSLGVLFSVAKAIFSSFPTSVSSWQLTAGNRYTYKVFLI